MRGLVVQCPDSSARDGRWWGRMMGNNDLPQDWVKVRLGDITEPSKERVNPEKLSGVPYIGLEHIEKETGRLLGKGISDDVRSTKAVFHSGDLLYGKLRPYLNKVYVPDFDGVCSTDILVFPKNDKVDSKYLFYRFMSGDFVRYANRNVSGVQHPRVSPTTLAEYEIELPPRPEQERIVAKLEETYTQLEAGIAELQNAKAQLKRYRAAVLKSAVEGELTREWREAHQGEIEPAEKLLTRILSARREKWEAEGGKGKYKAPAAPIMDDLPELPDGWVWASLEQSASFEPRSIQSGPFGSSLLHSEFQETGILAIGIDNVLDGKFSMGKQHRISQKKYGELEKYTARPLDVLITVMATVGRCSVVPADLETAIITKHVYRISANQKLINSYFLMYCLLAESVTRHQIFGGVRGQTRPGINKSVLVNLAIPIPPLREQKRIIEKIDRRLSVADKIEKELDESLVRAERLRGSILKNAFEGKL